MNVGLHIERIKARRESLSRLHDDAEERGLRDLARIYARSIMKLTNQIIVEQFNAWNGPRR